MPIILPAVLAYYFAYYIVFIINFAFVLPVVDFELYCPKCRKVTTLGLGGVDDLPVNYALQDVVEVMPTDESISSISPSTPLTSLGHSLGKGWLYRRVDVRLGMEQEADVKRWGWV